jgi:glycylpeptide N-tetradecanoyltransferase
MPNVIINNIINIIRSKRLAPVLIKEITRRVNVQNVWQAVYTAGVVIPKPVARCRYWHRSLNPKKLYEVKFSRLSDRMTLARAIKLYKVRDQPSHPVVPMEPRDVPTVTALLRDYLSSR